MITTGAFQRCLWVSVRFFQSSVSARFQNVSRCDFSLITRKSNPWANPADGLCVALDNIRSRDALSTGCFVKLRYIRRL